MSDATGSPSPRAKNMQRSEPKMKNVAIILQDLRSGGSERFASRLSLLLSEKFNVYVLVFDASEKRFDCAGEFVDLGLPAGKGTVKRAVIMLKRAAAIRKFVKEHDICTAYSFTHAPNEALALSGAKCKNISPAATTKGLSRARSSILLRCAAGAIFSLTPSRCRKMRGAVPRKRKQALYGI